MFKVGQMVVRTKPQTSYGPGDKPYIAVGTVSTLIEVCSSTIRVDTHPDYVYVSSNFELYQPDGWVPPIPQKEIVYNKQVF